MSHYQYTVEIGGQLWS